jgi:hypothetical protein
MKFKYLIVSSCLLATLFFSCEEKPIIIPPLEVGDRKVVVEELTGIRCTNCPDGAAVLQALSENLGDNLIVVALHAAAGYDEPYPESRYDFRTPDSRAVADYLYITGDPGAPAASIDRMKFNGEEELFTYRLSWPGYVNSRAAVKPELGLFVLPEYDDATRQLNIKVNIAPDEDLSGDLRLSVYITEDSIADLQLKNGVKIVDYMHRHVFRDALSDATGDPITEPLTKGGLVSRSFSTVLPTDWKSKHCAIVAFLHRNGDAANKEILQADEQRISD